MIYAQSIMLGVWGQNGRIKNVILFFNFSPFRLEQAHSLMVLDAVNTLQIEFEMGCTERERKSHASHNHLHVSH